LEKVAQGALLGWPLSERLPTFIGSDLGFRSAPKNEPALAGRRRRVGARLAVAVSA
jgi:hypothetical protein